MEVESHSVCWSSENDIATHVVHFLNTGDDLLFEQAVNPHAAAVSDLAVLAETLRKENIETRSVADVILQGSSEQVEDFLVSQIESEPTASSEPISLEEIATFKKNLVHKLSSAQRMNAVANSVTLKLVKRDGVLSVESYDISPLTGLSQDSSQLLSSKGVVYARAEGNRHRVRVWKQCLSKLGYPTLGSLPSPLQACGRDVVLASSELSLIGSGRMTDEGAIRYLMDKDILVPHELLLFVICLNVPSIVLRSLPSSV